MKSFKIWWQLYVEPMWVSVRNKWKEFLAACDEGHAALKSCKTAIPASNSRTDFTRNIMNICKTDTPASDPRPEGHRFEVSKTNHQPMQFRSQTDARLYSPNGDIAHNMIQMMRRAAYAFDPETLDAVFKDYMLFKECDYAQVGDVVQSMAQYLYNCNDPQFHTPEDALKHANYFETNPAAQIVFLSKLGQLFLCAYFTRTREANDPEAVRFDLAELCDVANQAAQMLDADWIARTLNKQPVVDKMMHNFKLEDMLVYRDSLDVSSCDNPDYESQLKYALQTAKVE